jgi:four helix bundle protein
VIGDPVFGSRLKVLKKTRKGMNNHKDLDAWRLIVELVAEMYRLTGSFPKEEIYGLTSQIRRAAVSIPSNIAEGAASNSTKEFIQFLHVSLGSAAELETQRIIAERLGYVADVKIPLETVERIKKVISGLIRQSRQKRIS